MADSTHNSCCRQTLLPFGQSPKQPAAPFTTPSPPRNFAPPANRTDTSQVAAAAIAAESPTIRGEVYRLIVRAGSTGRTNEELARAIGREESTVSARVNELHDKLRLIRDSGQRRKTTAGRDAIVWIANANHGGTAP